MSRLKGAPTDRPPRIVYLSPPGAGANLRIANLDGSDPLQLTDVSTGVWDFAVSPDSTMIAYSALNMAGGADVWVMDVEARKSRIVAECGKEACLAPQWSPDGTRIAFERRPALPGSGPADSRVWIADLAKGETVPLFADAGLKGHTPRWSFDGQYLSYYDLNQRGILFYNFASGQSRLIPTEHDSNGEWSPVAPVIVYHDLFIQGETVGTHLFFSDLSAPPLDLSGTEQTQDFSPAWSPDGKQIAFVRNLGGTVYQLRVTGTSADSHSQVLLQDTEASLSSLDWSPRGDALILQRYNVLTGEGPSVVRLDLASGKVTKVIELGTQPAWLR
ncbi:MAG: PD40 domain-containing protein [Chloroflexi bacterium]|nr:PD40 domain-containing protein [Chloroflexota bacterium]